MPDTGLKPADSVLNTEAGKGVAAPPLDPRHLAAAAGEAAARKTLAVTLRRRCAVMAAQPRHPGGANPPGERGRPR